jgi:hypothetical protein
VTSTRRNGPIRRRRVVRAAANLPGILRHGGARHVATHALLQVRPPVANGRRAPGCANGSGQRDIIQRSCDQPCYTSRTPFQRPSIGDGPRSLWRWTRPEPNVQSAAPATAQPTSVVADARVLRAPADACRPPMAAAYSRLSGVPIPVRMKGRIACSRRCIRPRHHIRV